MRNSRWLLARLMRWASLPWLLVASLWLGSSFAAAQEAIPSAESLHLEALQSLAQGYPLLVLYTRPRCPYCERIRKSHLLPLMADQRFKNKLVLRQIDQTSSQALADFQGQKTTQKAFAASRKIKLVPVVAFYGANGEELVPPIVGARIPDYYQGDLEAAIEEAREKLVGRN